jgi:spermidine/putrescine transport system permease protein
MTKYQNIFKHIQIYSSWLWLSIFSLTPVLLIFLCSFASHNNSRLFSLPLTFNNFCTLNNYFYAYVLGKSLYLAGVCTLICLIIGYPFAFIIARMQTTTKHFAILLIIIPFWTSSLVRTYAMITLLKTKGVVNNILIHLGFIKHPLPLLFSDQAVIIGIVYNLLPFMILPLITSIERLDHRCIDAAKDLGANRFTTFTKIIVPLTMPGIVAGCILVFLPAMTLFYIPDLLGNSKTILLGNIIQNQFLVNQNWPLGAAISVVFMLILALLLLIYWRTTRIAKGTSF